MKGLLYKELRQNRLACIFSFLFLPLMSSLMLLSSSFEEGEFQSLEYGMRKIADDSIIMIFLYIMSIALVDSISTIILKADESKKWAYFISSTPQLPKGQVLVKYIISLFFAVIGIVSVIITNAFFNGWTKSIGIEKTMDIKWLILPCFFIVILLRAVDIPFALRFGSEKGAKIKGIVIILLVYVTIVYFLFGPLPVDGSEIKVKLMEMLVKYQNGEYDKLIRNIEIISAVVISGLFVLSYFISTKVYLKGIETYDK